RAYYRAAAVNDQVTPQNVEGYANSTALHQRLDAIASNLTETRARGVDPDGLVYLIQAEVWTGQAAESISRVKDHSTALASSPTKDAALGIVLTAFEGEAALWLTERLVAEAGQHPGRISAVALDQELINQAFNASGALPETGPGSAISAYMLAKRRIPMWIEVTTAHGWGEGANALALSLIVQSAIAERFLHGEQGATMQNGSRALARIDASLRSVLDASPGQRALRAYQMGWYVTVEEEAEVAPLREQMNAHILGEARYPLRPDP
ncbi:MAG: hypothetical protein WDA16_14360, partial [Candidatus Thermoplasmatota archaeon]